MPQYVDNNKGSKLDRSGIYRVNLGVRWRRNRSIWNEYLSGDRRKKLGEGHALYGFQGKRGACFLCDI